MTQGLELSRRRMLQSAAIASVGGLVTVGLAQAQANAEAGVKDFIAVSKRLTGRDDLDGETAARMYEMFAREDKAVVADLKALDQALASDIPTPEQGAQAMKILSAWYLGMVGNHVVAYENALMFKAVSRYLNPRSYCGGPPGFWVNLPA